MYMAVYGVFVDIGENWYAVKTGVRYEPFSVLKNSNIAAVVILFYVIVLGCILRNLWHPGQIHHQLAIMMLVWHIEIGLIV